MLLLLVITFTFYNLYMYISNGIAKFTTSNLGCKAFPALLPPPYITHRLKFFKIAMNDQKSLNLLCRCSLSAFSWLQQKRSTG